MTFVNEFVPEDQKDKFDPEVFKLIPAYPPSRPYRWTIDRERDIFLIRVGGSHSGGGQGDGYEPPDFYTLSILGKLVKFDLCTYVDGDSKDNTAVVKYDVFNIVVQDEGGCQESELQTLIVEALNVEASGLLRNPKGLLKVEVQFSAITNII